MSKVLRTFRAHKASCETAILLFSKADLLTCFNVKKAKRIAKFDGFEPQRCEDNILGIMALRVGPYTLFYSLRCFEWRGGTLSGLGIIFFEFFYIISIVFVMVEHAIFATNFNTIVCEMVQSLETLCML